MITYTNEYGTLILEPTEYVDVNTIHVGTTPDEFKFDLPTAEQIALITENRHIQIAFEHPGFKDAIVIHHSGPRTVAVCRIHTLTFKPGVNATEEIERHARREPRIPV